MPSRFARCFNSLLTVCGFLECGLQIQAAPPRAHLVEYVTQDAGLCVELLGLKDKIDTFLRSNFFDRMQHSPFYRDWQGGHAYQQLRAGLDGIELVTGEPPLEAVGTLFGTQAVLAVYPTPAASPEWVLLSEADPAEATKRIDLWTRLEERQITQLSHAGLDYYRSQKRGQSLFYAVTDTFFVVTASESRLQALITQNASPSKRPTEQQAGLEQREEYQQLRKQLHRQTAIAVFADPHLWPQLRDQVALQSPVLQPLQKRFHALAAGWRLDDGLGVEFAVDWNHLGLPGPWDRMVQLAMESPQLVNCVPANAVVVMSGCVSLQDLVRIVIRNVPAEKKNEWPERRRVLRGLLLGWDIVDDLFPRLGDEWLTFMTAPAKAAASDTTTPTAELVSAYAIDLSEPAGQRETDESAPTKPTGTLSEGLDNTVNVGLNLLAAGLNVNNPDAPTLMVRSRKDANGTLRWIDSMELGAGLRGLRPATALRDDGVVLATSPDAVVDFIDAIEGGRFLQNDTVKAIVEDRLPRASQIMLIRGPELAEVLPATIEQWATLLGHTDKNDLRKAKQGVEKLCDLLKIADWFYFSFGAEPGLMRMTFGAMTDASR